MNAPAAASTTFVPLRLAGRSVAVQATAVFLGTLFLAASSWIEVPMFPVPMTMQTFAVTLVGALFGCRLGLVTVLAWLGEAAVGFPVLAGGAGGLAYFAGPTAGYLAAFPIAAAFVGWLAERGWTAEGRLVRNVVAMLAGMIGAEKAYTFGFAPFVLGGILKAVLATATIEAVRRGKISL